MIAKYLVTDNDHNRSVFSVQYKTLRVRQRIANDARLVPLQREPKKESLVKYINNDPSQVARLQIRTARSGTCPALRDLQATTPFNLGRRRIAWGNELSVTLFLTLFLTF